MAMSIREYGACRTMRLTMVRMPSGPPNHSVAPAHDDRAACAFVLYGSCTRYPHRALLSWADGPHV